MAAPSVPTINPQPLAEDQQLSFDWEPQGSVDNYYIYDAPATLLATVSGSESITTVTGLTNGQTYNAYIVASNVNGVSDPASFRPFQPGLPPTEAPLNVSVTRSGASNALIEWTPTGESLAAPIQWYAVEAISQDPAASNFRYSTDGLKPDTTQFITGLNGFTYKFTVQGINCPGYSPAAYTSSISIGSGSLDASPFATNNSLSTTTPFGWLPGTQSYTLEFFFYAVDNANSFEFLFGDEIGGPCLLFAQYSGAPYIDFGGLSFTVASSFSPNVWYHIALSRDGTSGDTALWINGTREDLKVVTIDYNTRINSTLFFKTNSSLGALITNINFIQGNYKYNPLNATITVPTENVPITPNTIALYCTLSGASVFLDETGNYETDTSNAGGLFYNIITPFV
jgi:hypothetical protein